MLNLFAVFTTGGIILWSYSPAVVGAGGGCEYREVMTRIMQSVIIEGTATGNSMVLDNLCLHWALHRDLGLVFFVPSHPVHDS